MVQLVVRSFLDSGTNVDSIDYPDQLLSLRCKDNALQMVYQAEYAMRNRSFSHTKDRGEVSGTTKKMYRQKGTGGARHGSRRVSQFRGGGVTFGPKFALRKIKVNKNLRLLVVLTALNKHIDRGSLIVLDALHASSYKTKELSVSMIALYTSCLLQKSQNDNCLSACVKKSYHSMTSLFIDNFFLNNSVESKNFLLASRNIIGLSSIDSDALNIFHLMNNRVVFIAKDALINLIEKFQGKLLNGKELKVNIG